MGNNYGLTNTELELMKFFWSTDEVLMFSDIANYCKVVCGHKIAPQTLHTHLSNLVKKGILEFERNGYKKHYYAKYSEEEWKHKWAGDMLMDSFNGSLKELILALAPQQKYEKEEIAELHQMLDAAFAEDKQEKSS